ncbi:unnamed protein product [Closterium sp. NIES-54]
MDADSSAGGKGRDDNEASCSLVGIVEPIVSLAPEAGEDFQAMAAAVQANPEVVLLDSGCSHHLMGTKDAFIDLWPTAGGKLARHTFPDQGSNADDVLAVVHVDLCGPFRVAAKDGSLYFLLLKDRKTRYMWVRPVAKKSDALQEFMQWLAVTERQTKKSKPLP